MSKLGRENGRRFGRAVWVGVMQNTGQMCLSAVEEVGQSVMQIIVTAAPANRDSDRLDDTVKLSVPSGRASAPTWASMPTSARILVVFSQQVPPEGTHRQRKQNHCNIE